MYSCPTQQSLSLSNTKTSDLNNHSTVEYDYVESNSISEHLIRPVCTRPAVKPVVNWCGHMFCYDCLNAWNSNCSICRAELRPDSCCNAAQPLRAILDYLVVRCVECNAVMRHDVITHHQQIGCCNPAIDIPVQLESSNAASQQQQCPAAEFECTFQGDADQLEDHLLVCPYYRSLIQLRKLQSRAENAENQTRQLQETVNDLIALTHRPGPRPLQQIRNNQILNSASLSNSTNNNYTATRIATRRGPPDSPAVQIYRYLRGLMSNANSNIST